MVVAVADGDERPQDSAADSAKADAMALAEQAEAEAVEAEALAAAARARARAMRLRNAARNEATAQAQESPQESPSQPVDEHPETPEPPTAADADTDTAEVSTGDDTDTAADAGSDETVPASPPEQPSPRRRLRMRVRAPRMSTIAKAAAILVICGLLAASGYMVWYERAATQRHQRAAAFAAAARQGVINMTSLDFNNAKDDVQRVIDSSTGEFRDDFMQRAADFTKVVEESKVVTEGTVNTTAVQSMGKDSAVVLVAATSHVTNAFGAKQEPRAWRLRVTVAPDGGQLKMSQVEFVP